MSAVIELTQVITRRGYCDVNDWVNNTLGAVVGYGLGVGISRCMERLLQRKSIGKEVEDAND